MTIVIYTGSSPSEHTTPASWACVQPVLPHPVKAQLAIEASLPTQLTFDSQMAPVPRPKIPLVTAREAEVNPSMRHTTRASSIVHWTVHTVPQGEVELYRTSTRPWYWPARVPFGFIKRTETCAIRDEEN